MKIFLLLLFTLFIGCQSQKTNQTDKKEVEAIQDERCISFDQRQCQTDAFAKYLPSNKNSDSMFQGMQSYLAELDIKVLHMRIDMNFHEFTCAACDVCPESHRFFLSIASSEIEKFQDLNLLNLTNVDCEDHF